MARKPNYGFERRQREQARAKKKADRLRAKQEKSEQRKAALGTETPETGDEAATPGDRTE
jgi:hypothetical protein